MAFRVSIPPAVEPLHVAEIKAHLRIPHDAENTLLSGLLMAVRQTWEDLAGRALVTQTVTLALDEFPACEYAITLPRSPVSSIVSVTYTDSTGGTLTMSAADYTLDTFAEPNRLLLAYGKSWPIARYQPNAVLVTCVAGYATPFTVNAATDVVTFTGRAPVNNESFRVWNTGGALPGGLQAVASSLLYVVNASGQTCQLSLTQGGAAINITDSGSGWQFAGEIPRPILDELKLWVGDRYENREAMAARPHTFLLSRNYRLYGVTD